LAPSAGSILPALACIPRQLTGHRKIRNACPLLVQKSCHLWQGGGQRIVTDRRTRHDLGRQVPTEPFGPHLQPTQLRVTHADGKLVGRNVQ
jgi:hypothetical protein